MDWYVVAAGNGSVKPLGAIDVFSRQGFPNSSRTAGVLGMKSPFLQTSETAGTCGGSPSHDSSWTAGPRAERLTSGPGLESQAAMVAGPRITRLVFAALNFRIISGRFLSKQVVLTPRVLRHA